jgi:hypothetical protein
MAMIGGRPAIAFTESGVGQLMYVRADNTSGSVWGTVRTVDSGPGLGWYPSMTQAYGRPVISYYDYSNGWLKFARAEDDEGTEWETSVIDGTPISGGPTSIAMVQTRPMIGYGRQEFTGGDWVYHLRYVHANDWWGASWSTPVEVIADGNVGTDISVANVNGLVAMSYYDNDAGALRYTVIIE